MFFDQIDTMHKNLQKGLERWLENGLTTTRLYERLIPEELIQESKTYQSQVLN